MIVRTIYKCALSFCCLSNLCTSVWRLCCLQDCIRWQAETKLKRNTCYGHTCAHTFIHSELSLPLPVMLLLLLRLLTLHWKLNCVLSEYENNHHQQAGSFPSGGQRKQVLMSSEYRSHSHMDEATSYSFNLLHSTYWNVSGIKIKKKPI